jgi:hypothetical protein
VLRPKLVEARPLVQGDGGKHSELGQDEEEEEIS